MSYIDVALQGLVRPRAAFNALRERQRPTYGVFAVATRFVLTSLTTVSWLRELGTQPFASSSFVFLPTADYYAAEVYFLPLFGLLAWLLMSAIVGCLIAFSGAQVEFGKVLNVVGIGMLIPMPIVWAWDWSVIASGSYTLHVMAVSHTLFQLWETGVETVGVKVVFGIRLWMAAAVALLANITYVLLAMLVVR